jgi:hypothetical protein
MEVAPLPNYAPAPTHLFLKALCVQMQHKSPEFDLLDTNMLHYDMKNFKKFLSFILLVLYITTLSTSPSV